MSRNRTLRCFARRIRFHITSPHRGVRNILAGAEDALVEVDTWGVDITAAESPQERHSSNAAPAPSGNLPFFCSLDEARRGDYSIVTVPAIAPPLPVSTVSLLMVYAYVPGVEKQRLTYS
jgi:hypothetical protein